jgi:hypothetical protein
MITNPGQCASGMSLSLEDNQASSQPTQREHAQRFSVIRILAWYFAVVKYIRIYSVLLQAPWLVQRSCALRRFAADLLVVLGGLHVPLLDVLPLTLPSALAGGVQTARIRPTPLLRVLQILSDPVSKALLCWISTLSFRVLLRFDVQLHAEGGAKDGEQHGGVAAEDRAAGDGQYRCGQDKMFAQREAYLYTVLAIYTRSLAVSKYEHPSIDLLQTFWR